MVVRQIVDSKLAQFAYLVGCPRTGEALVQVNDLFANYRQAARPHAGG
ncbi:MAG: hypothetical protein ABL982_14250 [Vicinamibacterales bacterium]